MPPLTRMEYEIALLAFSWLVGFAPLFAWHALDALGRTPRWRAPTWVQCGGLALLATAFVRTGLGIYLTIDTLFVPTVLEPAPRALIWRAVWNDLVYDLAMPLAGLLILLNAFPFIPSQRAPRRSLFEAARDGGLAPRRTWGRDALDGLALFAFIAVAYMIALLASRLLGDVLAPGDDESRYWINITLVLIVLRSGMAGLTEELLYRGMLLSWLSRAMPFWAAAVAQAILFGFAHAGYGSWLHVLGPAAFGLGMAWVTRTTSVWVAILLHAEVNVMFFAFDVSGYVPGVWWLVAALAVINVAAALVTRLEAVRLLWMTLLRPFARRA